MSNGKITTIPVLKIAIRDDRLRVVDESAVTALCNDIEANGLNQPIMVRTLIVIRLPEWANGKEKLHKEFGIKPTKPAAA